MNNVPLLRQAFDLLSYTVSPIKSSSHLCLDEALTPVSASIQKNAVSATLIQCRRAGLLFKAVQIRCSRLNDRALLHCTMTTVAELVLFTHIFYVLLKFLGLASLLFCFVCKYKV